MERCDETYLRLRYHEDSPIVIRSSSYCDIVDTRSFNNKECVVWDILDFVLLQESKGYTVYIY